MYVRVYFFWCRV